MVSSARFLISAVLLFALSACAGPQQAPTEPSSEPASATIAPSPTDSSRLPTKTPGTPDIVSDPAPTATAYLPSHPAISAASLQPGQTPYAFLSSTGVEVRYLVFLPEEYRSNEKWPLIVFLAGSDGYGTNIDRISDLPPQNYVENPADFPFIVVSPQLADGFWSKLIEPIDELLLHLVETLPIDPERLYLTGYSLGGYGTWTYALKYPNRFAAIAPIAGGPSVTTDRVPENICVLKDLPIWAFHGAEDDVPPAQNIEPVEALEACDGKAQLTLYPDTGHDAWTPTYTNPAFYEWLLEQINS